MAGLGGLRANPLRATLATLGVVIGVGALVSVRAAGDGVERYARQEIARTTDLQIIRLAPRTTSVVDGVTVPILDYPVFDTDAARALREAVAALGTVALTVAMPTLVGVSGDTLRRGAMLIGTLPETGRQLTLSAGAFLDEAGARRPVAVLSRPLAEALGVTVGDSALVGRMVFRILGITDVWAGPRFQIYVPIEVARAAAPPGSSPPPPELVIRVGRVEDVPPARQRVERWLAHRWPDWRRRVAVAVNASRVEQSRRALLTFELLLSALSGVSLVVGGIGIMNVLLASVAERTREIGVRRAAGARRRDILTQFLAESVAITGAGSVVGMALGALTATLVTAAMRARTTAPVHAVFAMPTFALAAVAAIGIGLAFGLYPAIRAARLPPIEAIRHE